MRLFDFWDTKPIHAYVIAIDHHDAHELFEEYVLQHGGDPDKLRWRELSPEHLDEALRAVMHDALTLGREGLVVEAGTERWVFIVPLSVMPKK